MDLFINKHGEDLGRVGVCTVNIKSPSLNSADDIFINSTNYLIGCNHVERIRRPDLRRISHDGARSGPSGCSMREMFEAAWTSVCGTGPSGERKLVVMITYGEGIANQALASFITAVHQHISSCTDTPVSVSILLLCSSAVPLPSYVRKQAQTQMEISRIYRTAPSMTVFERVVIDILANMLLPFTICPQELQRVTAQFICHDHCVWSYVNR